MKAKIFIQCRCSIFILTVVMANCATYEASNMKEDDNGLFSIQILKSAYSIDGFSPSERQPVTGIYSKREEYELYEISTLEIVTYDWEKQEIVLSEKAANFFNSEVGEYLDTDKNIFIIVFEGKPISCGIFLSIGSATHVEVPVAYISRSESEVKLKLRGKHDFFSEDLYLNMLFGSNEATEKIQEYFEGR